MTFSSPYAHLSSPWLRGALHAHSTNSDGVNAPKDVWGAYAALGYHFATLTDHCKQPSLEQLETDTGLVTLPGCEYRTHGYTNFASPEVNLIGIHDPLPYDIDWPECGPVFKEQGAFVIYNHPSWNFDHWPTRQMLDLRLGHALEIYNAVGEELAGSAESTTQWDALLSCGYRVWGVATDDAHKPEHRGKAWVVVNTEPNAPEILDALKSGRFYSSTGVHIDDITINDGVIRVTSPDAKAIRFIAERGQVRKQIEGSVAEYRPSPKDVYVRIELFGEVLQKAWTNPIFIETRESEQRVAEHTKWFMEQPLI